MYHTKDKKDRTAFLEKSDSHETKKKRHIELVAEMLDIVEVKSITKTKKERMPNQPSIENIGQGKPSGWPSIDFYLNFSSKGRAMSSISK